MKGNFVEANLARSAFLRVRGYELAEIVPIGHRMVAFSFIDHDGQARQTAETFSNGATAPAEALLDCFSDLKAMMYKEKSRHEGKEAHDVIRKQPRQTIPAR